jgi:hypothetical protein
LLEDCLILAKHGETDELTYTATKEAFVEIAKKNID